MVGGPKLAAWLTAEMKKRGNMTRHRLATISEVDKKTITKILEAKTVRRSVLDQLAKELPNERAHGGAVVPLSAIPDD
jgi:hypothetical protein